MYVLMIIIDSHMFSVIGSLYLLVAHSLIIITIIYKTYISTIFKTFQGTNIYLIIIITSINISYYYY